MNINASAMIISAIPRLALTVIGALVLGFDGLPLTGDVAGAEPIWLSVFRLLEILAVFAVTWYAWDAFVATKSEDKARGWKRTTRLCMALAAVECVEPTMAAWFYGTSTGAPGALLVIRVSSATLLCVFLALFAALQSRTAQRLISVEDELRQFV